jgi:hypothetical protein
MGSGSAPPDAGPNDEGSSRGQSSGSFKGVSFNKRSRKWQSQIYQGKKKLYLGNSVNGVDAMRAFDCAARLLRGAGTFTNFPSDGYSEKDLADMAAFLAQKVCS